MNEQHRTLTMSQKERERLKVLHRLDNGELSCRDVAECLGITERHLYRLRVRYRTDGDEGLIHRLRGCPSNRGYNRKVRTRVLELYRERYSDYGPTLFAEMIAREHTDTLPPVNHETLRRWLLKASLWTAERTRKAHRRKRERREHIGSLVQFDGSDHDWFEGRGPRCCLLVAIDDASGRLFMRFARSENAHDVLRTLKQYIERYGIPREIYTDKATVYHPPSKGERLTDVGKNILGKGGADFFFYPTDKFIACFNINTRLFVSFFFAWYAHRWKNIEISEEKPNQGDVYFCSNKKTKPPRWISGMALRTKNSFKLLQEQHLLNR
jgi:transposase